MDRPRGRTRIIAWTLLAAGSFIACGGATGGGDPGGMQDPGIADAAQGDPGSPPADAPGADPGGVTDPGGADPGSGQDGTSLDPGGDEAAAGDLGSPDPGAGDPGCLPARGTDGRVVVGIEGEPILLREVASNAQNTMDTWASPVPARRLHALAAGTCGKAGVLWLEVAGDPDAKGTIRYQQIAPSVEPPEGVVEGVPAGGHDASLFFLEDPCVPIVMKPEPDGYAEHRRESDGTWTRVPPDAPTEGGVTRLSAKAAWTGSDGTMNVLGRAEVAGAWTGWLGRRAPTGAAPWTWARVDLPDRPELLAVRVGDDGAVHALYRKTEFPCDPCDMALYYGRRDPGGDFIEEVVQDSKWGAPDDEFAADPDLALDAGGNPVVAAAYQRRVVTGSLKSSELRVYGRGDGSWCHEVVATTVDGYQGSDGNRMTGATPGLVLDPSGRIHVVFQDLSQWHDGNGWSNGIAGQVRHAVRSGRAWTLTTLVNQRGQTAQPRPLQGFLPVQVAVAPDGNRAWIAGTAFSWDTDSIYNMQAMPITFQGLAMEARFQWP